MLGTVDVIMATYNGELYVEQQIESILRCFENINGYKCRLLVSDDASTDKTLSVIQGIDDKRVQVISSDRVGGPVKNFSRLLKYTDADYVFFADQDDVWNDNKLKKFMERFILLESHGKNKAIAIYSDVMLVDENLKVIASSMMDSQRIFKEPTLMELIVSNSVTGCAMSINRAMVEMVKNELSEKIIMHDWFISLVAKSCGFLSYIPETTVLYRQHSANQVGSKSYSLTNKLSPKKMVSFLKISTGNINDTLSQAAYLFEKYRSQFTKKNDVKIVEKYTTSEKLSYSRVNLLVFNGARKRGFLRNLCFSFLFYIT